jgi:hypothetical protein
MMTRAFAAVLIAGSLAVPPVAAAQQATSGSRRQTPPPGAGPTEKAPGATREPLTGQQQLDAATPQGISVVLVLGDMASVSAPDNVPAAARKALADMRDFLPYKSYRLLDVQWTLCCGRAPVVSRLRGPDGRDYELTLTASVERPKLSIRFVLDEPRDLEEAETAVSPLAEELRREVQRLEQQLAATRKAAQQRHEVGMGVAPEQDPKVLEMQDRLADMNIKLAEARQRKAGASSPKASRRAVMDASFRMDVGETVVVGTSRVKGGDKALIALLTAVPQKPTSTTER